MNLSKQRKRRLAVITVLVLAVLLLTSTCLCFAANDNKNSTADTNIGTQFADAISKITSTVKTIVTPIAVLAIIGCGVYFITGSDERNIAKAKKWGLYILIGLILIYAADPIVNWAQKIGEGIK